ncbi:MAG: hypothetical protein FWE74_03680 [Oscillospiraceae bacterium]|nr:hypothetical protein [Oscillospiraceae bacterium]
MQKGHGEIMAFKTKALLSALAGSIAKSTTLKEAYMVVMKAANVEGVSIPSYEEALEEIEQVRK